MNRDDRNSLIRSVLFGVVATGMLIAVGILVWAIGGMSEPRPVVADGIETENPEVTTYYDTDFDVICWLYQPTTSSAGISCLSVTDLNTLSEGYRTLPK